MSQTQDNKSPIMKCADCLHCKQYREVQESTGRYVLKVKCVKGHWKRGRKRGGYDLYKVLRRRTRKCPDFVSMSDNEEDRRQYLRDLAQDLPVERIVYEPNGRPVDIMEVASWRSDT